MLKLEIEACIIFLFLLESSISFPLLFVIPLQQIIYHTIVLDYLKGDITLIHIMNDVEILILNALFLLYDSRKQEKILILHSVMYD